MKIFRVKPIVSALSVGALVLGMVSFVNDAGAAAKKPKVLYVPIAALASQTGSLSGAGAPYIQGAQYGVSVVNKTGFKVNGKTYKFKLTVVNDNSDTATAVQAATGLISKHNVAMFGPLSVNAPPVAQLTEQAKVIIFDPSSGLAQTAGPPTDPYTFITNGNSLDTGVYIKEAIKSFLPNATSVALLAPSSAPVTTDIPLLQSAFSSAGLTFYNDVYPSGTTVLSSILTTVASQNPSVVLMLDSPSDYQVQAPQFAAAGVPKTVTMLQYGGTIANCTTLGAGNGYPCIADPVAGVDMSAAHVSAAAYKWIKGFAAFTNSPNLTTVIATATYATWTYDYVSLLAQAMTKAKTVTNTTKIANALRGKVVDATALVGRLSFNAQDRSMFPLEFTYVPVSGNTTSKSFAP